MENPNSFRRYSKILEMLVLKNPPAIIMPSTELLTASVITWSSLSGGLLEYRWSGYSPPSIGMVSLTTSQVDVLIDYVISVVLMSSR